MKHYISTTLSVLVYLPWTLATPLQKKENTTSMVYGFDKLKPSTDLCWTPCYDNYTCTLLTVPLDYNNTSVGSTNIAFIKWTAPPSNITSSTPPQDILINPGGPGGSGVGFLRGSIEYFKRAAGAHNNYIGFDPRGVENSGPDLSCFPGQHGTRLLFDKDASLPTDVHDPNVLAETWSRAGAIGEWCSKVHSSGNSLARYANTVAVANDMRHYTELLAKSKGEDPLKSQLWYWGVSYGTVLGLTFASLFPNRIGRMILDGVVDADDYYMGKWQSIADADKAVESFFTYCYSAGASNCAFWANSSQAIKTRYNAVIDNLKKRPALVATPGYTDFPTIFRFRDYQTILLQAVYTPDSAFPQLAAGLVALESGHAELIANITGTGIRQDSCKPHAQSDDIEPLPFIAGNDANGRYLLNDYDAWVNHAETLYNQSHYIGEAWALLPVNFRKLNIRAPLSQVFTGTPSAANTSNPILFVSNTIDAITPLRAAKKMQGKFGGAGLLMQEAVGHSSGSTSSKCTWKFTTQYMKDGSLPAEGTLCQPDRLPFQNSTAKAMGGVMGRAVPVWR